MDVFDGNGRQDTFRHQTNGTYTRDEFFREGTFTNSVFRLTFADSGFGNSIRSTVLSLPEKSPAALIAMAILSLSNTTEQAGFRSSSTI